MNKNKAVGFVCLIVAACLLGCGKSEHRFAAVNAESLKAEVEMVAKDAENADEIRTACEVMGTVYASQIDNLLTGKHDVLARFRGKTASEIIAEFQALDEATRLSLIEQRKKNAEFQALDEATRASLIEQQKRTAESIAAAEATKQAEADFDIADAELKRLLSEAREREDASLALAALGSILTEFSRRYGNGEHTKTVESTKWFREQVEGKSLAEVIAAFGAKTK